MLIGRRTILFATVKHNTEMMLIARRNGTEKDCPCLTDEEGCNYACPCAKPFMSGVCWCCNSEKGRGFLSVEAMLKAIKYLDKKVHKLIQERETKKNEYTGNSKVSK
jgi:hypothetical protein